MTVEPRQEGGLKKQEPECPGRSFRSQMGWVSFSKLRIQVEAKKKAVDISVHRLGQIGSKGSAKVEAVEIHYLSPCSYEVLHELLVCAFNAVHLC